MNVRHYLRRRLAADAASARLARLGAQRLESAWLLLWAMGIGKDEFASHDEREGVGAWLLASSLTPRALLWPGALDYQTDPGSDTGLLGVGDRPSTAAFERLWLWERLARPRRWRLRVQPATCHPVALPLWLGYRDGRHTRLLVLSGVSGEPLASLKPAVLAGLGRHAEPRR